MLRITSIMRPGERRTLKVEGRIAGDYVGELSRVVSLAPGGAASVALEMSQVTFVDQPGVALLQALRRQGIELVECSTFIDTLVNGGAQ